jgi:hypothetical protein
VDIADPGNKQESGSGWSGLANSPALVTYGRLVSVFVGTRGLLTLDWDTVVLAIHPDRHGMVIGLVVNTGSAEDMAETVRILGRHALGIGMLPSLCRLCLSMSPNCGQT